MLASTSAVLRTILLVEENRADRIATKWFLTNFGFAVDVAENAEEALALFDPRVHDVVITENGMTGMSGLEMAHVIKLRSASTPVIMFTQQPPDDRSCLDSVVQRPAHLLAVKEAVDKLLIATRIQRIND